GELRRSPASPKCSAIGSASPQSPSGLEREAQKIAGVVFEPGQQHECQDEPDPDAGAPAPAHGESGRDQAKQERQRHDHGLWKTRNGCAGQAPITTMTATSTACWRHSTGCFEALQPPAFPSLSALQGGEGEQIQREAILMRPQLQEIGRTGSCSRKISGLATISVM